MNFVKDICDNSEFRSLISQFSKANHIYIKCFDAEGQLIFSPEISSEEQELFNTYLNYEKERVVLNSFIDMSPETIIEGETFSKFIRLKAVAIRDEEKKILMITLISSVIANKLKEEDNVPDSILRTTDEAFDESVLLFSELSQYYFAEVSKNNSLISKVDSLTKEKENFSDSSRRNEALAEILKGLESEKDFFTVSFEVLETAGRFLSVSNAFLLEKTADTNIISLHSEWAVSEDKSLSSAFNELKINELPFLKGRPYTISSDSILPENFREFFSRFNITAGIFLPISLSENGEMYLCFVNTFTEHRFTVTDLKFADDVKRVLSSVFSKRSTENSLKSSYSSLDTILENTGCGIVVFETSKKNVLYTNSTFEEMFSDDVDRRSVERVLFAEKQADTEKTEIITDKSRKYYSISFSKIKWVDGKVVSMGTFNDITDLKNYQKKIFAQANTDYLTGLFNRQKFEADFEREIRDAVRSGEDGTLILIDLDDFKGINEGLGNNVGDMLLKEAGEAIRLIAGKRGYAYRLSGDEFAILLPSIYKKILPRVINAVEKRFTQAWQLDKSQYYCTMCMGIAFYPKDGTKTENIFQHADFALRVAKKKGRSQVEYYSTDMDTFSKKRLDIESAMHEAVTHHIEEFVVYYQPLIDASKPDHPCIGAEALMRWNSEKLGLLYPSEFVSIAEYLGLIIPIGNHVLSEATKKCRYWNDFGHPEYRVNVNFSMIQLMQKDAVSTIKKALDESGLNPKNLIVEVTESLAENDSVILKDVLNDIRALGVRVSLDDFGTGYSTFSRLKDMPFDEVKIDKSFVDGIGEDFFSDSFVKNVSDLADSANMDVIVEGVETDAQKNALENLNVDIIQGYLYDKPLSEEEFENKYLT